MPVTLKLVTPVRVLPSETGSQVTFVASDGEIGVRQGHAPLAALVGHGVVEIVGAVLLPGPLCRLDAAVAAAVLAALGPADAPGPAADPLVDLELRSFAAGHRTLDAALPALAALTRRRLAPAMRGHLIDPTEAALLVAATAQLRPIGDLVAPFGARGREALTATLRAIVGRLLA